MSRQAGLVAMRGGTEELMPKGAIEIGEIAEELRHLVEERNCHGSLFAHLPRMGMPEFEEWG